MNGYLIAIIGTVLLSAVLTAVLPDGKTAGVIKGITKLACIIAIVAPIPSFLRAENIFDNFGEKNTENLDKNVAQSVIQTDGEFIKYYCEMRIRNTEEALEQEIEENFSLVVKVDIDWQFAQENVYDSDSVQITKITVQSDKKLEEGEKSAVCTYLTKNYCREVLIE